MMSNRTAHRKDHQIELDMANHPGKSSLVIPDAILFWVSLPPLHLVPSGRDADLAKRVG